MFTRNGLLGLVGVLAVAGGVVAKPPGAPLPPHAEGREATPVAREFYAAEPAVQLFSAIPTLPSSGGPRLPVDAAALADFVTGFRAVVLNRFTMPLGAAAAGE